MRNSFRHLFSHLLEKLERIHCQILLKIASEILSRIFSWISYGIFFPYSFFNALAVFHRVNRAILREIPTWFCLSFFFLELLPEYFFVLLQKFSFWCHPEVFPDFLPAFLSRFFQCFFWNFWDFRELFLVFLPGFLWAFYAGVFREVSAKVPSGMSIIVFCWILSKYPLKFFQSSFRNFLLVVFLECIFNTLSWDFCGIF